MTTPSSIATRLDALIDHPARPREPMALNKELMSDFFNQLDQIITDVNHLPAPDKIEAQSLIENFLPIDPHHSRHDDLSGIMALVLRWTAQPMASPFHAQMKAAWMIDHMPKALCAVLKQSTQKSAPMAILQNHLGPMISVYAEFRHFSTEKIQKHPIMHRWTELNDRVLEMKIYAKSNATEGPVGKIINCYNAITKNVILAEIQNAILASNARLADHALIHLVRIKNSGQVSNPEPMVELMGWLLQKIFAKKLTVDQPGRLAALMDIFSTVATKSAQTPWPQWFKQAMRSPEAPLALTDALLDQVLARPIADKQKKDIVSLTPPEHPIYPKVVTGLMKQSLPQALAEALVRKDSAKVSAIERLLTSEDIHQAIELFVKKTLAPYPGLVAKHQAHQIHQALAQDEQVDPLPTRKPKVM